MTLHGGGSAPRPVARLRSAGRAFLENRPVFTAVNGLDELADGDPVESRAKARAAVANPDVRSLMAVPIRVGDQRLGVLEVHVVPRGRLHARGRRDAHAPRRAVRDRLRNARLIEELQRSNRLKDDFLANLSHEVRTPLTGIVGWAEVLLDSHGGDPAVKRALEAILGQSETLSRMLADLIDLSRIDNFGLELRRERVRLSETIAAALDAVAPGRRQAGRRDPLPHRARPARDGGRRRAPQAGRLEPPRERRQVLAVRRHGGGDRARARDGGLELAVADEGHGIDPEFLPLVFERFRQEETSSNRRYGGLGVGLSIARAIVEAHGGTIVAESEGREKGSRFRVTFPRERVVAPVVRAAAARERAVSPRRRALSRSASGRPRSGSPRSTGSESRSRPSATSRSSSRRSSRSRAGSPGPRRAPSTSPRTCRTADGACASSSRRTTPSRSPSRSAPCPSTRGASRAGSPCTASPLVLEDAYAIPEGRPVPAQRRLRRRDRVPDARDARRPDEGPSRGARRRPPAHEPARAAPARSRTRTTSSRSSSPSRHRRPSA